jgi:hypothetical protein
MPADMSAMKNATLSWVVSAISAPAMDTNSPMLADAKTLSWVMSVLSLFDRQAAPRGVVQLIVFVIISGSWFAILLSRVLSDESAAKSLLDPSFALAAEVGNQAAVTVELFVAELLQPIDDDRGVLLWCIRVAACCVSIEVVIWPTPSLHRRPAISFNNSS